MPRCGKAWTGEVDGWINGDDVTRKESSGRGNELVDREVTADEVALIHEAPNSSITRPQGPTEV